ncbi:hypothetical protein PENTCL1PPCAC_30714, partial [Pristionchus entomophagus]
SSGNIERTRGYRGNIWVRPKLNTAMHCVGKSGWNLEASSQSPSPLGRATHGHHPKPDWRPGKSVYNALQRKSSASRHQTLEYSVSQGGSFGW